MIKRGFTGVFGSADPVGMPARLSRTVTWAVLVHSGFNPEGGNGPATASSIELSMISATIWCSARYVLAPDVTFARAVGDVAPLSLKVLEWGMRIIIPWRWSAHRKEIGHVGPARLFFLLEPCHYARSAIWSGGRAA